MKRRLSTGLSSVVSLLTLGVPAVLLAAGTDAAVTNTPASVNATAGQLYLVGFMIAVMLFVMAFFFGMFVLWIFMIIDCANRDFPDKKVWIMILAISILMGLHTISAPLYYFMVKRRGVGTRADQPPSAPPPPPTAPPLTLPTAASI
jgi:hypothetical protein